MFGRASKTPQNKEGATFDQPKPLLHKGPAVINHTLATTTMITPTPTPEEEEEENEEESYSGSGSGELVPFEPFEEGEGEEHWMDFVPRMTVFQNLNEPNAEPEYQSGFEAPFAGSGWYPYPYHENAEPQEYPGFAESDMGSGLAPDLDFDWHSGSGWLPLSQHGEQRPQKVYLGYMGFLLGSGEYPSAKIKYPNEHQKYHYAGWAPYKPFSGHLRKPFPKSPVQSYKRRQFPPRSEPNVMQFHWYLNPNQPTGTEPDLFPSVNKKQHENEPQNYPESPEYYMVPRQGSGEAPFPKLAMGFSGLFRHQIPSYPKSYPGQGGAPFPGGGKPPIKYRQPVHSPPPYSAEAESPEGSIPPSGSGWSQTMHLQPLPEYPDYHPGFSGPYPGSGEAAFTLNGRPPPNTEYYYPASSASGERMHITGSSLRILSLDQKFQKCHWIKKIFYFK